MKKVVLALAVVFSVALVSCSSKENKAEDTAVADTATEQVCDSAKACCDSAAADTAAVATDSAKAE